MHPVRIFFGREEIAGIAPVVGRYGVETGALEHCLIVLITAGRAVPAVTVGIHVELAESGFLNLVAEFADKLRRDLFTAEIVNQFLRLPGAEIEPAVHAQIVRTAHIFFNIERRFPPEGFRRDVFSLPVHFRRFPVGTRMRVDRVVVAPHQSEFDLSAVWCIEESLVQAALTVGTVVETVPVKNKSVYTIRFCRADFLLHDFGLGFILISPERNFRLNVSGKTRCGILRHAPFGPSLSMKGFNARIAVPVREIIRCDDWTFCHFSTPFL